MGQLTILRPMISFVIPAFNEEQYIGATLDSVLEWAGQEYRYEIIVVDNGSVDQTCAIARAKGATVLTLHGATIGALRNAGARHARGEIIIFIDADVTLTSSWPGAFRRAESEIRSDALTISGSMCSVPANASWIERTWFAPHNDSSLTHLGSAHLIVRRDTFLSIGGFDEALATGEDYDFCHRIQKSGGKLFRLARDTVEHHGYPKTVRQFIKREMWHGSGDFSSVRTVVHSKVALAALMFAGMHALVVASMLAVHGPLIVFSVASIIGLCAVSSIRTYRPAGPAIVFMNIAVYYLYYCGRAASFLRSARQRPRGTVAGWESVATSREGG